MGNTKCVITECESACTENSPYCYHHECEIDNDTWDKCNEPISVDHWDLSDTGVIFETRLPTNTVTEGKKYDSKKDRWDLLPWNAVEEIVKGFTYGAQKYGDYNWKYVTNAEERYFAALMRHFMKVFKGETIDPESGISHLAHAGCNLLMLMEIKKEKEKK